MTFAFTAAGTKDQVDKQLDHAVKRHIGYNQKPEEIQQVVAVAKHWLSTGKYPNGVFVETNGHLDNYGGALTLTIKPLSIPEEPVEPATSGE